jgi:hypothetical protein
MNPIIDIYNLKKKFVSLIQLSDSNKEKVKYRRTIGLLNEAINLLGINIGQIKVPLQQYKRDDFICPICQEIMVDPVVTPSGQSFERNAIEQWLKKNKTDPITRQYLTIEQLYPNRALKQLIEKNKQNISEIKT